MPSREVGASDIANLAAAHQGIEGFKHFINWCNRVEAVHVIDVDVVGLQPAKAVFTGADQVVAR